MAPVPKQVGWLLLFCLAGLPRGDAVAQTRGQPTAPSLDGFFVPPVEFRGDFGGYRSPLRFDNGTLVKAPADWAARRKEILAEWHRIMGPWPPLLLKPGIKVLSSEQRENFAQIRVRVDFAAGQTGDGYLLVPRGRGPFPAVLVPFYDPETSVGLGKSPLRDFALQLARRGFVTLAIGSPGGDARRPVLGGAKCQPLSYLAYIAANCANALAARPEVDPTRIGVVGHSYGGKWAMFASCLYERFACAAWSDPGVMFDELRPNVNYWDPWYLGAQEGPARPLGLPDETHPRTGAYRKLVEAGHDLHELHALMAPRPFLVSGGSEDLPLRWRALNHSVEVNRLLGHTNRVAMTNRQGHNPTEESNEQIYRFFERFLMLKGP